MDQLNPASSDESLPPFSPSVADIASSLEQIRSRIRQAGGASGVRIVAVTKGQPLATIVAAAAAGLLDFGENYADELVAKASQIPPGNDLRWHFQGRLQSNKINRLRPFVSVWQTVDSADRITALSQRVPGAQVMIQLDSTQGRADRSGAFLGDVPLLVSLARSAGLLVTGLMTVAPLEEHGVGTPFEAFQALSQLADELDLVERSMGMSDDFEDAIRAGSTMIRIGSALFGSRPNLASD
jgi:PLP dependent protein